jgi:uncharacterized protein (TIGR02646 family)
MIRVDRRNVSIPDQLRTGNNSPGDTETEKAKKFFQQRAKARAKAAALAVPTEEEKKSKKKKDGDRESFKFKAYSGGDVKSTLKKLFHDKCGYCEIDYGGAVSDIEHFRPKGALEHEPPIEVNTHPDGYYWLGADWNNLIYSCQHCNRGETHDHSDQVMAAPSSRVSGKRNFFPLSDETQRLQPCDPVDAEEPYRLLLDPCRDAPGLHLEFLEDGLVKPRLIGERPSRKGSESIRLYGLRRLPLFERRSRRATDLMYTIAKLNDALAALRADLHNASKRAKVCEDLSYIRTSYLAPERPFLAMCRTLFIRHVDLTTIAEDLRAARGKSAVAAEEAAEAQFR